MPILYLDSDKCNGCLECMRACSKTYEHEEILELARLKIKKDENGRYTIQSCKNCENAPCIEACPENAIIKLKDRIIISPTKCNGCKKCIPACPFGAIQIHPTSNKAIKCIYCGICVKACPENALSIVMPTEVFKEKGKKYALTVSSARKWL